MRNIAIYRVIKSGRIRQSRFVAQMGDYKFIQNFCGEIFWKMSAWKIVKEMGGYQWRRILKDCEDRMTSSYSGPIACSRVSRVC